MSSRDRRQEPTLYRARIRGGEEPRRIEEDESSSLGTRRLEQEIRRRGDDDEALQQWIERLAPEQRQQAHLALVRLLGAPRASSLLERGGQLPRLPLVSESAPSFSPDDRLARSQALGELLETLVVHGDLPDSGLLMDLLAGVEAATARSALAYLHRTSFSTSIAVDRMSRGATARLAGPGLLRFAPVGTGAAALLPIVERRAVTLWRRATQQEEGDPEDPAVLSAVAGRGHGLPLPPALREDMEEALDADLRHVRIHADAIAAAAARAIHARAFTVGDDIFFADGAYAPDGEAGRLLLAHELAHVAQAQRGAIPTGAPHRVSNPSDALEQEAESVAVGAALRERPREAPAQKRHRSPLAPPRRRTSCGRMRGRPRSSRRGGTRSTTSGSSTRRRGPTSGTSRCRAINRAPSGSRRTRGFSSCARTRRRTGTR